VLAFLSQAHVEPDLTVEMFLMDGPVSGFGALELVEPPAPSTPVRIHRPPAESATRRLLPPDRYPGAL